MTVWERRRPRTYAHVPRTILWLIPGGELRVEEGAAAAERMIAVEPFYLSKWPVTNEQFEAFDQAYERSTLSPGDRDLAVGVSWEQADAYCRWYAELSKKPMRLPTSTEWRYACQGGTDRAGGSAVDRTDDLAEIDRRCWHVGNSEGLVKPPEQKAANGFGLHGMLGSVWEWVAPEDPAVAGGARTLCGGSFRVEASKLRLPPVRREAAWFAADDTGFRVARSFRVR